MKSSRRRFIASTAAGISSASIACTLGNFNHAVAGQLNKSDKRSPYGPLKPTSDINTGLPLLMLPEGFSYQTYGWTGQPMADGRRTPSSHDGMGVIDSTDGIFTLCRNHERGGLIASFADSRHTYDANAPGGTTNVVFDGGAGKFISSRASLSGTVRNCAGGVTPWGTWLTCEETTVGSEATSEPQHEKSHGWIFEVPANGQGNPKPIKTMGRFVHEAIAVDPRTSYVYETEDRGTSGLYRFRPNTKGKLHEGGTLEMLRVPGHPDLSKDVKAGAVYGDLQWVKIDDPELAHTPETTNSLGVYIQGRKKGGTNFNRLEGIWYYDGSMFFDSTSGGNAKAGQIWELNIAENTLHLVFESPSKQVLNMPDNMAVSSRGGIIICEDCGITTIQTPQGIKRYFPRLHALSPEGEIHLFAENNTVIEKPINGIKGDFRGSEWTGANFSPDGKWLFANIQTPGFTVAITGPWEKGCL
ncbi:MAG: phosphatase [Planctomycetaceae bacterium]|nr:phosphatase [Planctomycetaceae bacterium]|tara:strand:- start:421 stop:1833 length:1413 start_codon:yes stop_codon:yes gene_type:complete